MSVTCGIHPAGVCAGKPDGPIFRRRSALRLVEFRMKRAGISCVVFRGGMSMQVKHVVADCVVKEKAWSILRSWTFNADY